MRSSPPISVAVQALEPRLLLANTFIVSTTADSGSGSLREAIESANALPSPSRATIVFDFFNADIKLHTIKPLSSLPTITAQVDIQGTTDEDGNPLIELDGINAGAAVNGLVFSRNTAGNTIHSQVSGLIVDRFAGDGIVIAGSGLTDVFGCRIGTDFLGKHSRGNGAAGVHSTSANNQIGLPGAGPAFANVISANQDQGIVLDTGAVNNVIRNNFIGTDSEGKYALGNLGSGILANSPGTTIGGTRAHEGNVISGSTSRGILLLAGNAEIFGNKVGTNAAGTAIIKNNDGGVILINSANVSIGDGTTAGRNLIAGTDAEAINLSNTTNIDINNNFVGTDVTGTKVLGSTLFGIGVNTSDHVSVKNNVVGGIGDSGVLINGDSNLVTVSGNYIGVDKSRTRALPNGHNGIEINTGHANVVESNVVAHNTLNGVEVIGDTSTGNVITHNSIFSNGHLGIKLGADDNTPTPNHSGAATGPNSLQNYPVITSALISGSFNNHVTGTISALANTVYRLEFYVSDSKDPSGFGEGQTLYTELDGTTNGSGVAAFDFFLSVNFKYGQFLTATATRKSGNTDIETSEFSAVRGVDGASITGKVFNDENANGKLDDGEDGLSGRTVFVDVGSGRFDSEGLFAKTDSDGNYRIFGVVLGTVRVRLAGNSGWRQTLPSPSAAFRDVQVASGGVTKGVLFGQAKSTIKAATLAIDAGFSGFYNSTSGQKYSADTQHPNLGMLVPFSVIGTDDDPLFYIFASGSKFSYSYAVANGEYDLKLHFADSQSTAAGQRKFNVSVNQQQVLTNFDIFQTAGRTSKLVTKTVHVKITNGKFILTLQGVTGQAIISAFELIAT